MSLIDTCPKYNKMDQNSNSRKTQTGQLIVNTVQARCLLNPVNLQTKPFQVCIFLQHILVSMLYVDRNICQLGFTHSFANRKYIMPDTEHPQRATARTLAIQTHSLKAISAPVLMFLSS